jgi:L-alanine-DL-glutamate epimerase-like enolase superfamily enzyme
LSVNDAIRYAKAFEPSQLTWAEDLISYKDWRGFQTISDATTTPTLRGEDAFGLEEGFQNLIEKRAIDIIQPDPETCGGLRETKRIADYADMQGIPTVLHFAGSPVGCRAGTLPPPCATSWLWKTTLWTCPGGKISFADCRNRLSKQKGWTLAPLRRKRELCERSHLLKIILLRFGI